MVELSEVETEQALQLLKDPNLLERIVADMDACGMVGESTNKLAGYLAVTSRKLDKPLAVVIQSSSSAGKTSLMDAVLSMMPDEDKLHFSGMTGQSLFYLDSEQVRHKTLAISEEEGIAQAGYALKLLQSEGELRHATVGRGADGRSETQIHHVEGPVQVFFTTTAMDIDEELVNRCLVLSVDESRDQTGAIQTIQRGARTFTEIQNKNASTCVRTLHRNAQRLIAPLTVCNPYAPQLTFANTKTRLRRDHVKYLTHVGTEGVSRAAVLVVFPEPNAVRMRCCKKTWLFAATERDIANPSFLTFSLPITMPHRDVSMKPIAAFCFSMLIVISPNFAQSENWGSWRGPTSNGISTEKNVPIEWSKDKNVAWRVELPGPAGATPAVWGDQIFLTSIEGNKLLLLCFGTDGKEQWRQQIAQGNKNARGDEGNSASPSPITDGKHVWAFMGTGHLACFTVSGDPVWNANLQKRYGKFDIAFGMSATPVMHDGRLFVQLIHGDGKPSTQEAIVVAMDAQTGKDLWKVDRVTGAAKENEHSYASPMIYDFGDTTYLITHGADYTIAYALEDGKEIWRLGGLNPQGASYHPTLRFVSSPASAEGIVVCPTAKKGPVFAIRPDKLGDLTDSKDAILWIRDEHTPDVPSPLIHEDLVYLCRENGILLVLDRKTGEEVYMERTHGHRHRASPVYADGHIYLTARDGKITIVKTGRKFEIVKQNDTGELMSASPVISGGTIYLRTFDALWAIRNE